MKEFFVGWSRSVLIGISNISTSRRLVFLPKVFRAYTASIRDRQASLADPSFIIQTSAATAAARPVVEETLEGRGSQ